ncbi:protein phosphatase [Bacillus sp. SA1-12]|uniref:Stp1/IreP family PP2C-type Ser/Thr phosphatase n=1 Tax=Bacillus sp. SA1-12 TaxID=1455638 RepID=UPI000625B889|nr:Stp1/IreP family PP2C-type Ser/Thr phosphatase [Bacillus sp. SA1-12]KKI92678.1 protein phosphatase [Bacillus sp. SA1-12]
METFYLSDRGRVRPHNEDCVGVFENEAGVLAIIADGMGGHLAGDIASQMTISCFKTLWEQAESIASPQDAEAWFADKVLEVNKAVYEHSISNPECQGMGTTIVGAIVTSSFATIGHIGDSRCYLLNNSGYKQVTQDHSLVNELVRSGLISKEDAEHHPRKNVLLRSLGTEQTVELDVFTIEFEQDDVLLLCSDGLSNKVTDQEMQLELSNSQPLPEKAKTLVELANENGGEDNISLVIVRKTANHELGEKPC